MEKTEVVLTSANETQTCSSEPLDGRLKSFGAGCLSAVDGDSSDGKGDTKSNLPHDGRELHEVVDVLLVSQAFSYGRYLLFSSATEAPMNLQGLWADGPSSSWNGDYHLNINMQESYWAVDAVGAGEGAKDVMRPLMKFISDLRKGGAVTAREVYGVDKGWVAHGFTDNRMHCGMAGEAQWSLCVTCGAWLALQAFDHLTFHFDRSLLLSVVLPSLRGIAEFFLEYMYVDPVTGESHTGPTTSPENSYSYAFEGKVSTDILREQQNIQRLITLVHQKGEEIAKISIPKANIPSSKQLSQQQLKDQQHLIRQQQEARNLQVQLNMAKARLQRLEQDETTFIAFSPALDISVLRQAANALTIAVQWAAGKETKEDNSHTPYRTKESDERLAQTFMDVVTRMPDQALPVNGMNERTLEYPAPLLSRNLGSRKLEKGEDLKNANGITVSGNSSVSERPSVKISEPDPGHRHWSAVHWMYPGIFHPSGNGGGNNEELRSSHGNASGGKPMSRQGIDSLYEGTKAFMIHKANNGGGHTGWSAAWEACLHARLRNPEAAMLSLTRLLLKFSAPNLLALHPPLSRNGPNDCATCFEEASLSKKRVSGVDSKASKGRGMVTEDDYKFQIDGNLGYVAAVTELIVQSHLPGYILLLPALPLELSEQGAVKGIRARGDLEVSLSWQYGHVTAAMIIFKSHHPWLGGIDEDQVYPGFFSSRLKYLNSSSIERESINGVDSDGKRDRSTSRSDTNEYNRRNKDSSVELFISSPNRLRAPSTPVATSNVRGFSDLPSCLLSKPMESLYYAGSNNADIDLDKDGNKGTHKASDHWLKGTYLTSLFVTSTEPCVVSLCGISDVENECQRNFEVLSASSFLLKKNRME